MSNKSIVLACIFVLLYAGTAFSDASQIGTTSNNFLKILVPAKPAAFGEAYCALSNDIDSIYYNPAGLGRMMSMQASFTNIQWFQDVRFFNLNLLLPVGFGNLGFSINYMSSPDMDKTTSTWTPADIITKFSPYSVYGSVSFAKEFTDNLFIGTNIKILDYSLDPADPKGTAMSFMADFGIIYELSFLRGLSMGAVFKNIGPATTFDTQSFTQPIDIRGGIGYAGQYFSLEGDVEYVTDNDINYFFGGGLNLFDVVFLRAGYKGGTINQPTFGGGLAYAHFALDYAYVPYTSDDLGVTHRITLSYQFGAPPAQIQFYPPVFSPNRDKYLDYSLLKVNAQSKGKIKGYTFVIYDNMHNTVRTMSVNNPATRLFWNGANAINAVVPDGVYYGSLKVNYGNGIVADSNMAKVEVDNTPPQVGIDANPKTVKPGTMTTLMCPVTFSPALYDLHGIGRWKLVIATEDNKLFKSFTGVGDPGNIIWDGSDDSGQKTVRTGATYKYIFYASDTVGNWGKSQVSSVKVLLREIVINLSSDTLFDIGKADVKISVYKDLQKISEQIKGLGSPHVVVEGHTDNQALRSGLYRDNMTLSQFRARAVVKFFVELFGMDEGMFTAVGKGDTIPIATNDTPEGRQKNRRVSIRIQASKWE
jgi:flagellar motor protein MotB